MVAVCESETAAVLVGDTESVDAANAEDRGVGEPGADAEPDGESDSNVAAAEIVAALERTVPDGVLLAAVADCIAVRDPYELDDVGDAEDESVTAGEVVGVCETDMEAVAVIVIVCREDCVLVAEPEGDVDAVKVAVEQPLGVDESDRIDVVLTDVVPVPDIEAVCDPVAVISADVDAVDDDVCEEEELTVGVDEPVAVALDDALPVAVTEKVPLEVGVSVDAALSLEDCVAFLLCCEERVCDTVTDGVPDEDSERKEERVDVDVPVVVEHPEAEKAPLAEES